MMSRPMVIAASLLLLQQVTEAREKSGGTTGQAEIVRDEFGVPHIFSKTVAGAAYASGYAQAQDRLNEILMNYRKAEGTMSEVFGPQHFANDYRQRLWQHREIAKKSYATQPPQMRQIIDAYHAGLTRYMKEHPEKVPDWAPKIEPWHLIALGRYIIYGWPEGEMISELMRAGITPEIPTYTPAYRGSNQMLIAPSRTTVKGPIAVIDPHLSWYGEFRFYEIRLYGGDFNVSGAAIAGLPFPSLGHSKYCSIAMTTGGPDTSDIFEEEVTADGKYKFKGELKPLTVRKDKIGVKTDKGVDWREITIESTHHGPIVAHKNGKASAATPYANETGLMAQSYSMMMARNLAEMKTALAGLQLMQQNIMIGTVDGDIYYVRNGRVPVRPKGCDGSKPMPGATGECEWQGLHKLEDLVQVLNPPQGYMENNNISPEFMMKDSPMKPDKYAADLFNPPNPPNHQRGQMSMEELDAAKRVTPEQAIRIAFSSSVYHAELWQERVARAMKPGNEFTDLIAKWDRRAEASSRAALAFYLFKTALPESAARAVDPPSSLTDEQIADAVVKASAKLKSNYAADATYGSVFRVGRKGGKRTFPVSGGTLREAGMATPRAISFSKEGDVMVGHTGQTSTQIVILTKPLPSSYMVIPLGESDDPASPHFDDQAEKLFSRSMAKPTYFLRPGELKKHSTGTTRLTY